MATLHKPIIVLLALLFLFPLPANSEEIQPTGVPAIVERTYDGDTLIVDAHPWPGITIHTSVRLLRIDTPEGGWRAKCELERELAGKAKARLQELVSEGITLTNVRLGKYAGRVLADVITPSGNVADILIAEGHGRPYAGGKREGWCS